MLETIRLVLVQRALLLHMEMIKEIKLQYYNHKPSEYWKLADMFLFQKFSLILEYYLQLYYHLKCHRSQGRPLLPPSLAQFGCALSFLRNWNFLQSRVIRHNNPPGEFHLATKIFIKHPIRLSALRVESPDVGIRCERDNLAPDSRVSLQWRVLSWRLGCTIRPGGGELGDLSGPKLLGLHLQRLIERLNRVGFGEDAGVHRLSGCPGRRKPEGRSSQLSLSGHCGTDMLLVF